MTAPAFAAPMRVARDHPCLAGHFPGQPLVPAVLLLEQVAYALRGWRGERLARVLEAKFVAPLGPDEDARIELEDAAPHVRFRIVAATGGIIARGIVAGQPVPTAEARG